MADETKIENGSPSATGTETAKQKRNAPHRILPTERLSPEKWQAALRAYAVVFESNGGKPVTNDEAGAIISMAGMTIVMTNAFLCDLKLLTRVKADGKEEPAFIPSAEVLAYHKAHEWDPATAGEKLRSAFERMWFCDALVPRLKFRPYEEKEALTVLAEACGAEKKFEGRLLVLLELMVFAGVIVRDGSIVKVASASKNGDKPAEPASVAPVAPVAATPPVAEGHAEFTFILDPKRGRKVVVHAPHDMTQKEFERVRKWMEIQLVAEEAPPI